MASGLGIAGAALQALNRNAERARQERLQRAGLIGDILGSEEQLPAEMRGVGTGLQMPEPAGLLESIGLGRSAGPDIEQLITQKQQQARKIQAFQLKSQQFVKDIKFIQEYPEPLTPTQEANLLKDYPDPFFGGRIKEELEGRKRRDEATQELNRELSIPGATREQRFLSILKWKPKGARIDKDLMKEILEQSKGSEGFTLGPGQKRFGSTGDIIAEGGEKESALMRSVEGEDVVFRDRTTGEERRREGGAAKVKESPNIAPNLERDLEAEGKRRGLIGQALFDWKQQQRIRVAGERAGAVGQAGVAGRERGMQSVLAQRLDRIEKEAIAANQGKPLDASVNDRVSNLLSASRQVGLIEANFDKEFLGPIKGTQIAFEARRRVGSYINSPLGEKETVFRQALADIKDMLLRARSGAQINEQEYRRLSQMLPAASDEEPVFRAGLTRFDNELSSIIKDKIRLGKTPRSKLGSEGRTTPSFDVEFGGPIPPPPPGSKRVR